MNKILLRKELVELLRTYKALITLAVFFVVGLISPMLAKYTPLLFESIPDLPPGFADLIPEPTTLDSIIQYVQNTSQFGVLLVIVVEIALITPPIGLNVFIVAGMDPDVPMTTIFKGILPFFIASLAVVAFLLFFPELATFLPSLMVN